MKNKTMLKILFLTLILSSCGLIERFKTPEQPTDSKDSTAQTPAADATDDLFSKTMDETSPENTAASDTPGNITTDADLKSLEDEFSASGATTATTAKESAPKESEIALTPAKEAEAPVLVEEALPEIKTEVETPSYSEAGTIKKYRVKRGETLMQIAFKLYGDISKWKDIKKLNSDKLSSNTSLKTNTELKYRAPETPFVWNPTGNAYMIKSGETLGTISNTVYSTPTKWKMIWENNKPLIKNPNVIYAGFTLYYRNGGMANYVQPKVDQPKEEIIARELAEQASQKAAQDEAMMEDVVAQETKPIIEKTVEAQPAVTPVTAKTSAPIVSKDEETQMDEAIQTLAAPERMAPKEKEIDLINNITVPHEPEMAPDIDEEIQTL